MNNVIALSGVELLALGKEARQRYGYMVSIHQDGVDGISSAGMG